MSSLNPWRHRRRIVALALASRLDSSRLCLQPRLPVQRCLLAPAPADRNADLLLGGKGSQGSNQTSEPELQYASEASDHARQYALLGGAIGAWGAVAAMSSPGYVQHRVHGRARGLGRLACWGSSRHSRFVRCAVHIICWRLLLLDVATASCHHSLLLTQTLSFLLYLTYYYTHLIIFCP